jgi:hypothetical protein
MISNEVGLPRNIDRKVVSHPVGANANERVQEAKHQGQGGRADDQPAEHRRHLTASASNAGQLEVVNPMSTFWTNELPDRRGDRWIDLDRNINQDRCFIQKASHNFQISRGLECKLSAAALQFNVEEIAAAEGIEEEQDADRWEREKQGGRTKNRTAVGDPVGEVNEDGGSLRRQGQRQ